ncbi:MAG: hypothetical protein ACPGFB_11090 [Verrucomicrobiales bacterium]
MAIKLIGNYAKRLGLPGYSSHQFSVSVETELSDTGDIQGEATRIYHLLQDAVDREIQTVGFIPDEEYGLNQSPQGVPPTNGNPPALPQNGSSDRWSCSDKQKEFILKLIEENDFDWDTVEQTSLDRFSVGVRQLNKLQASGLISELLDLGSRQKKHNGHAKNGKGGRR